MRQILTHTKAVKNKVDQLIGMADETRKAGAKLQSAAAAIKPPPPKTAKLGDVKDLRAAVQKMQDTANFARYAKACDELRADLSPKGQQRAMLNNLCAMLHVSVEQHTGDKAGEPSSRRDTRMILKALRELKASEAHVDSASKAGSGLGGKPPGPLEKATVSDFVDIQKGFEADRKRLDAIRASLDQVAPAVASGAKMLVEAFSQTGTETEA
jgi:hypothetical protein